MTDRKGIWDAKKKPAAQVITLRKLKKQHRKKSSPVEPSRTKEYRQTKEHVEKRSRARVEGSQRHIGFTRSSSTGSREVETVVGGLCSTSGATKA